jgi:amidophosphoribosyltransferase
MEVAEIAEHIDADTLGYLSLAGLLEATGSVEEGFCTACLSGVYPTEIPVGLTKHSLEPA